MAEPEEMVQDGLLRMRDAQAFVGLSRSTLHAMMDRGELVYVKIGKSRRIPRRALVDLAARNLQGGWAMGTGGRDG